MKITFEVEDCVKDIIWKSAGQIRKTYKNFEDASQDPEQFLSTSPSDWLEQQIVPFTKEQIENEMWFAVDCWDGGALLSCESRLRPI